VATLVISVALCVCIAFWLTRASIAALERGPESDIVRQWVVTKYVLRGIDPYALASEILHDRAAARAHPSAPLFAIPKSVPGTIADRVLQPYGAPEATYPPPAVGLLALAIGWLRTTDQVLALWLGVNVIALGAVVWLLNKTFGHRPHWTPIPNCVATLTLLALYSPTYYAIANGQFSLLVLACVLLGVQRGVNESLAGLASGLALIKPSISLPFLLMDIALRRWRRVAIAISFQAALMIGVAIGVHQNPFSLVHEWLSVSQYFLSGMYTLQELINVCGLRGTPLATAITATALGTIAVTIYAFRRRPPIDLMTFVGVASALWMYHHYYDFVMLIPGVMVVLGWATTWRGTRTRTWKTGLLAVPSFLSLSAALTPHVIFAEGILARSLRWSGRICISALLGALIVQLVRRHDRTLRVVTIVPHLEADQVTARHVVA
jgi:hypothetical protein